MLIIFFTQNFKEAKIHFFGYKQPFFFDEKLKFGTNSFLIT